MKFSPSSTVNVLVYVDDILITGNDLTKVSSIISQMHKEFSLKDLVVRVSKEH